MNCSIEGCEKPVLGRGWCAMHYRRWSKYGNPETVKQEQLHGLTLADRILARTSQGPDCWEWTGSLNSTGYGQINIGNTPRLVHRVSWATFKGPIPDGMDVLHRCDNPKCVRPDHLFVGTHEMNMADKMAKKRHRFGVSRGVQHGCSVLTEKQVLQIRASTKTPQQIAEQFGISRRHVRDIRARVSWRHLK